MSKVTFLNHVYAVHGESSKATIQVLSRNSGSEDHHQSINHNKYDEECNVLTCMLSDNHTN